MKRLLQKTITNLVLALMLLTGAISLAQSADFNTSFAILSVNGGANTFYDLKATTANTDFQGANIGSFSGANTLEIKGAQHNVYICGGCDLTATTLFYRVYLTSATPGAFANMSIGYASGSANGCGGQDQQWQTTTGTTNVLAGLPAGDYTFEMYSTAAITCSTGTAFASNSAANYKATFRYCGPTTGALPAGNYAIPGCFATVNAAATYISTNGISGSGGVFFDVAAGHTETAPAGGIVLNSLANGTAANPIVFRKAGVGVNPTITANNGHTAGAYTDGVIKIIGGDYITFDGLSILENTNTTYTAGSNNMTEYGIALLNASATDGPKNITITNCTIDMNRLYSNSFGIYSNSTHTFGTISTALVTAVGGEHNNIVITKNTITDVNLPINVVGSVAATSQNDGLTIGGLTNGNTITNFGGLSNSTTFQTSTGTIYGVNIRNTKNYTVSYNSFTSAAVATLSTLRAVHVDGYNTAPTGTNLININNNTISLGANGANITAIEVSSISGVAGEVNINNNDFNNFTMPSGVLFFTRNSQPTTVNSISNNTFTNISVATTGNVTFITNGFTLASGGSKTVSNNRIVTGFTKTGAGGTVAIYVDNNTSGSVTGSTHINDGNDFSNITLPAASTTINGWQNTDSFGVASMPTKTITNNKFENWTTTAGAACVVMDLNGFSGTLSSVSNNSIKNITKSGAFTLTGISIGARGNATALDVKNNIIDGLNGGTSAVTGISSINTATTINLDTNTVKNFTGAGSMTGITNNTIVVNINLLNNTIDNLVSSNGTSMRGITAAGTSVYRVESNTISTLSLTSTGIGTTSIIGISMPTGSTTTAPIIASNTLHTFTNSNTPISGYVNGIYTAGSANYNINNNTIYNLNAKTLNSSTNSAAGIAGIALNSSGTTQKCNNNKIYNLNATATSADSVSVVGIGSNGGTATGEITRNTIYGLTNTTTGTNPFIVGFFGNGGGWTIANNMISLDNGANTNGMQVCGIIDLGSTAGARKVYHNSIHVGGSSAGTQVSAALQINANTGTVDFKNNIVNVTRTGGGRNCAIANVGANFTGLTCNNNVYNAPNANIIGIAPGGVNQTFAQWQATSGGDSNSYSNIPTPFTDTSIADLRLNLPFCSEIESGGVAIATVPNDYFNTVRNTATPDIGAHEFAGSRPTAITLTAGSTTVCKDSSTNLTAASADTTYTYAWSPATGLSATTGASVTATPLVNTTYTVTATNPGGCTTKKTILITVLPSPNNVVVSPATAAVCSDVIQIINSGVAAPATPVTELMETLPTTFTLTNTAGIGTAALNSTYFSQGANSVRFNSAFLSADVQYAYNTNVDLTAFSSAQLQFSHICATEKAFDYGYVQYSSDGGATWLSFPTTSYAGGGTLKNGVVSFDESSYADWDTQFTANTSLPTNALWKTETINIPASALTNQFRFRFRYTTDTAGNYYGWLIDNIKLTATNPAVTWSPIAGLYTDAAATVAYTAAADAKIVYAKNANVTTSSVPYTYTATTTLGSCTKSASSTITVQANTAITTQPVATQSVCAGSNVTFNVVAANSAGGYSYQWFKGATAVGTDSPSYTITGVTAADAANYTVQVAGDCGAIVTSDIAALALKTNVGITNVTAPNNPLCAGTTQTLTANGVVGTNAIVTWYTATNGGGTNLGASATLVAGSGTYFARVTGDCGTAEASITIGTTAIPTYANLQFPATATICAGSSFDAFGQVYMLGVTEAAGAGVGLTVEFGVNATNTNPALWAASSWSGTNVTFNAQNGNNDEYKATYTAPTSGTFYYTFRYRNSTCDWVYGGFNGGFWGGSNVNGVLTVNANTTITTQPAVTQAACPGSTVSFSVALANAASPTYQWKKNGTDISGANSATYNIVGVSAGSAGIYTVIVNGCGPAITSDNATLTVKINAAITNINASVSNFVCPGATETLTANGVGGTNTVLTWYNLAGTNLGNANPIIVPVGKYFALVSGECGAQVQAEYEVFAKDQPSYTSTMTQGGTSCVGSVFVAYGQVRVPNITDGAGPQGTDIIAEFGYNFSDTDPSTWNTWATATFNALGGSANNDEYSYNFTIPSAGTIYFAFRYGRTNCNNFYGGYSATGGGTWNASSNISGVINATIGTIPGTTTSTQNFICAEQLATDNIVLSGQTGNIIKWQKASDAAFTTPTDIAVTSSTLTVLQMGIISATTYFRAVVQQTGCVQLFSAAKALTVANETFDTVANAATNNWSNTSGSTINVGAILNSDYDTATRGVLNACNILVKSPNTLTIRANEYANIINGVVVEPGANVVINNSGSLIQINDINTNTGSIKMERTTAVRRQDYSYWSSPVAGTLLSAVSATSPANRKFQWLPTATNANGTQGKFEVYAGAMTAGQGYIVRAPDSFPTSTANTLQVDFTGEPFNGIKTIDIYKGTLAGVDDNFNLLGNPYPSAIDVIEFLKTTNNPDIEPWVNVWTHASLPLPANASPFYENFGSNYSSADYMTINEAGNITGPGALPVIAAGQGFFVQMKASVVPNTSIVTFNNKMRTNSAGANAQFYRTANTATNATPTKNRIWLDLVSSTGINRTLVGYIAGAANDDDDRFDAEIDKTQTQSFYSLIGLNGFAIQGRANNFTVADTVPLGVKILNNGLHNIAIAFTDGLFANNGQTIYLQDNLLNVVHNLSAAAYSFSATAGSYNNRFVLRYTAGALSNNTIDAAANSVLIFKDKAELKVLSPLENILSVSVFDILGRSVFAKNNINANSFAIDNVVLQQQTLIVKATLTNGSVVTKKVIF